MFRTLTRGKEVETSTAENIILCIFFVSKVTPYPVIKKRRKKNRRGKGN
uniref:Uncharacterized protein n=1 Tax=Lepeophtheirus salmonis TaxID=72036 RepID=A0A0K2SY13_LEPSM